MEQQNFRKQLLDYKRRIKEWELVIRGTRFNKEENTMIKFVVPLFEMLGWNAFSREVEFEYFIQKAGLADIALYVTDFDLPKILIEVKPLQDKFKKKYPTKIFNYLRNSKVNYGIATNGAELILYDNYRVRHDYKRGCKLLNLKLDDFIEYSKVLLMFSKTMVKKGILDKFAKEYHDKFYDWRSPKKKIGNLDYNEYILRLEFAKEFLRDRHHVCLTLPK